jgi:hypothetical protein
MNKTPWKKILLAAALIVFAAVVLVPGGLAHADNGVTTPNNPYSCGVNSLGTCVLYLIFYIINTISSFGVTISIWLVSSFLAFNSHLFDSPTVRTGYSIALGFANLGFVLGIIVIAVATILRSQTYGIKQILWKLVAVAIFVNFGLVVTKPIVTFSDSMTSYFVNAIGGTGGTADFAMNVANKFRLQQLAPASTISAEDQATAQNAYMSQCESIGWRDFVPVLGPLIPGGGHSIIFQDPNCSKLYNVATNKNPNDDFVANLMVLLFSFIFTCVVLLALLALSVLLIVRYVWLAMLLILLPLAWATYPFPRFGSHFSKWWDNFTKWTFFPALAMFFIYVALLTAGNNNQNQNFLNAAAPAAQGTVLEKDPSTGVVTVLSTKNNPANLNQLQVALDATILCALMLGGLFAASSMAGKAGQTAVNMGKSASKAVGGYVGRKTKAKAQSVGRNVADRAKGWGKQYNPTTHETTTRLQRWGSKLQNVPGFVPGARKLGTVMANASAPAAIQKNKEKEVQDYVDNNLKSLTADGLLARATSATAFANPTQSAAIAQELARRNLTNHAKITAKPGLMDKYVAAADRVGGLEKVTSNRPDLMPQRKDPRTGAVVETREEATERAVRGAKANIVQANKDVFNRTAPMPGMTSAQVDRATLALNTSQLSAIGNDDSPGSQERKANITNTIRAILAANPGFVQPIMNTSVTPPVATGKFELNTTAVRGAGGSLPALEQIVTYMEHNNNWVSVLN